MPDLMDAADLEALAKQFAQIPGYKDAKQQAEQCLQDAETTRENAYNDAVEAMQEAEKGNFSFKWEKAIRMLGREGLNGYRDVEELRKQAEQRRKECENAEEKERKAKERKNKRLTVAFVLVVLIACVVGWFVVTRVIPENKYQKAWTLRENGQYDDAIAAFAELGDYSDAAAQITETKYQQAVSLREAGEYESAIAAFTSLNDYRDAKTQIGEMKQEKYQQAVTLRENGQYEEAIAAFEKLGNYSDAAAQIAETKYQQAIALRETGKYKSAIAAFTELGDYGDVAAQITETKYQQAVALRENGRYDDAIAAFVELGDYSDAKAQIADIKEIKYQQAVALRANGQDEEAIAAFAELGDYSYAKAQISETKYQQANSLNASARYDEAYAIYVTLIGYKDVDKLLMEDANMIAAAAAAARDEKFAVGNYVTFGEYPQTAAGKDMTPIEWLVLARDGNKALLISRYALDAKRYDNSYTVKWENCTLRTWLNGTFYNKAFSSAEQVAILTTNVDNSKNQCYSGWSTSDNNTQDKVFLLSYAEAYKYFGITHNSSNTKSRVAPTPYAIAQGAYTNSSDKTADGTAAGEWWLRSPGDYRERVARVGTDGSLEASYIRFASGSVRPALWVNIEALGATSF